MSPIYIGFAVTFAVMITVNAFGNSLVIFVVLLNKSMKTPINYLLVNLAVADLTVALFSSVQFIITPVIQHPTGVKGTMLCKFITGGNPAWIGAIASIFSLIAMAFERYCAVLYPHSIRLKLTKRRILVLIILCWLLSVIFAIPGFWAMIYVTDTKSCGHSWAKPVYAEVYTIGWTIVAGLIPISIMGGLYSRVVYRLWFTRDTTTEASQKALLRCRRRATKMVIAVTVIYVLCWVPELSIYFMGFTGALTLTQLHHGIASVLIVFNSSINPVVYSLQSSSFRRHLSDLVRCKQKRNRLFPSGDATTHTSYNAMQNG
ncbi:hypothetical protein OS493_020872 [Desmophyllum pertusum]|uniref:G-protein coupled receptors family 1 profile domain-containing protein n=1 Tax=Desmophyllum pertusum TaxID=174260 RepID=A0A9W9YBC7_9CNID|nr:hypothetical protein OS493_020872 [Desmophyllum pertusum]